MDERRMRRLAEAFLRAWSSQQIEDVLGCYTAEVVYLDPNTRGPVHGQDALRRYLTKLFARWSMTWTLREAYPLEGADGYAVLWRATFRHKEGQETVEADGMDLVLMDGDRIARNEVYFDRTVLPAAAGG
jgi:ketosteroid isomerase-like protein